MTSSLVGSEMCIRDRRTTPQRRRSQPLRAVELQACTARSGSAQHRNMAVSYTHLTLPTICSV
eukprot:11474007-Prorocentrum_lima.AAC.1